MKYTVDKIKEIMRERPDTQIIYFWGHTPNPKKVTAACLSQWYDCYFEVEGVQYHTSEQYMMASKALLFDDMEVYDRIMSTPSPFDYKKLGRKIRNFDSAVWDDNKYDIVVRGNCAKFGQNPDIREFLLATGDAVIAEASPYDTIWGIGLSREEAVSGGVEQWKGTNLLGCVLMDTRDRLRMENE